MLYDAADVRHQVGIGQASVVIQSAPSITGPWTDLETPTTSDEADTLGAYGALVTPERSTYYCARFVGGPGSLYIDALSEFVKVSVRPLLGVPRAPSSVKRGRSFTVYGSLKPQFPAGQKTVKVKIHRFKDGRWVYLRQVSATNADNGASTRYAAKVRLKVRGKYRFTAYTVRTTSWAADSTKPSAILRVR